jgi:hypothetical protein
VPRTPGASDIGPIVLQVKRRQAIKEAITHDCRPETVEATD